VALRGSRSAATLAENATVPAEEGLGGVAAGDGAGEFTAAELAALLPNETALAAGNVSEDEFPVQVLLSSGGWYQGGDKMWGGGSGMESINGGNVHYYDRGMAAAHARCGGAGCALIVNPAGHRTVNHFHIHFVHYASYGASLKRRLESKVCGKGGWHGGGLPCGGKAAFFSGFPGVFSKAMTGGGLGSASVIAWPGACGGKGTIVELAYGCSIEHQIRGDFNPKYR